MNKPIVLIGTCKRDLENGAVQAVRETWLKHLRFPYKFFVGNTVESTKSDVLILDAPDGLWDELTIKTREALRWAHKEGYTHVFKCDVDTLVIPRRLQSCGWEEHEYYGSTSELPTEFDFAHGGPGYWLGARAIGICARAEFGQHPTSTDKLQDQWVGLTLLNAGIKPVHDQRFSMGWSYGRSEPFPMPHNDVISCHLSKGTGDYKSEWMREKYRDSVKVLIAVNSCWRDKRNGSNAAIRDTWGAGASHRFDVRYFLGDRNFTDDETAALMTPEWIGSPGTLGNMAPSTAARALIGHESELEPDEIMLRCSDQYLGLSFKTVESLRWALEKEYDFIFRAFTDTYIFPSRLGLSGFEQHLAIGWMFDCPPCPAHPTYSHECPLGGAGYWLSARAASHVIEEPILHWGEDCHVGFAIHNAKIPWHRDNRYCYNLADAPIVNRSKITCHMNERYTKWEPQRMYEMHRIQTEGAKLLPNWSGICSKCGHDKVRRNPVGYRCARCGQRAA